MRLLSVSSKTRLRRGPITGTKNAVGASLNPAYKLDEGYCHAYPTTWSGQFLAAFVLAAAMYSVGGALYGQRVLRRDGPLLQAHPHAARWLEGKPHDHCWRLGFILPRVPAMIVRTGKSLVLDGLSFARGGSKGRKGQGGAVKSRSPRDGGDGGRESGEERKGRESGRKGSKAAGKKKRGREGRSEPLLPAEPSEEPAPQREWKPTARASHLSSGARETGVKIQM